MRLRMATPSLAEVIAARSIAGAKLNLSSSITAFSCPTRFAVTDRVIVMHRGRKVAEKVTARTNAEELVQYMVGAREDAAA